MSAAARRARLRAFAKINLGLRVLERRADGYHELRTVFQTISLADRIDLEYTPGRASPVEVESSIPIVENIAGRAAELLLKAGGVRGRVRIRIDKRIPIGGGLGGGSSDAAAILLALPVLAGRRLGIERLRELGAGLGSDVPYFLLGGTALGLGRGTEIYPLPQLPAWPALVVAPAVSLSTAEAYRALGRELTTVSRYNKIDKFQALVWGLAPAPPAREWAGFSQNDFEALVFARFPRLRALKRILRGLGAEPALLSGSGSALFGIFPSGVDRDRACIAMGKERVEPVSLISRGRFQAAWWSSLREHSVGNQWPPQSRYAP